MLRAIYLSPFSLASFFDAQGTNYCTFATVVPRILISLYEIFELGMQYGL